MEAAQAENSPILAKTEKTSPLTPSFSHVSVSCGCFSGWKGRISGMSLALTSHNPPAAAIYTTTCVRGT
jgi:hypothetical protein